MFDKITLIPRSANMDVPPPETRITHHRAPTDESIRLLNEMQDKAMKNLLARIEVNNNQFSFKLLSSKCDWENAYVLYYLIEINGHKMQERKTISRHSVWDVRAKDRESFLVDEMYKHLSEILISYLCKSGDFRGSLVNLAKTIWD